MLIGIDGYEANEKNRVGVGRYAYEILQHIYQEVKRRRTNIVGRDIEFIIYLPDEPRADLPAETGWWRYTVAGPKKLWTFLGLPLAVLAGPRPDVIFSPTHYVPRFLQIPRVFSIMDLSYLVYPQMFRSKDLHQLINWTQYSVSHASRILTISEFSKNAIIKAYGVAATHITMTYPGLTRKRAETMTENFANLRKKYRFAQNYILSVGTLQPRKNYVRLIEAFASLKQFPDLELVIVGKKGWVYDEILAAPAKYDVSERVKFLDFVPDVELPLLYRNAVCLAMPSLYEGFGLPVLEAMANETSVVVSEVSSLPEIAGKAGIYVQPNETKSIKSGLEQAIKEHNSYKEKTRITLGLAQAKKFTWENAAKKTLAILEEVGKGKT